MYITDKKEIKMKKYKVREMQNVNDYKIDEVNDYLNFYKILYLRISKIKISLERYTINRISKKF